MLFGSSKNPLVSQTFRFILNLVNMNFIYYFYSLKVFLMIMGLLGSSTDHTHHLFSFPSSFEVYLTPSVPLVAHQILATGTSQSCFIHKFLSPPG